MRLSFHFALFITCLFALTGCFQKSYKGVVKDQSGDPIEGVLVKLDFGGSGYLTGKNGKFALKRNDAASAIYFEREGYVSGGLEIASSFPENASKEEEEEEEEEEVEVHLLRLPPESGISTWYEGAYFELGGLELVPVYTSDTLKKLLSGNHSADDSTMSVLASGEVGIFPANKKIIFASQSRFSRGVVIKIENDSVGYYSPEDPRTLLAKPITTFESDHLGDGVHFVELENALPEGDYCFFPDASVDSRDPSRVRFSRPVQEISGFGFSTVSSDSIFENSKELTGISQRTSFLTSANEEARSNKNWADVFVFASELRQLTQTSSSEEQFEAFVALSVELARSQDWSSLTYLIEVAKLSGETNDRFEEYIDSLPAIKAMTIASAHAAEADWASALSALQETSTPKVFYQEFSDLTQKCLLHYSRSHLAELRSKGDWPAFREHFRSLPETIQRDAEIAETANLAKSDLLHDRKYYWEFYEKVAEASYHRTYVNRLHFDSSLGKIFIVSNDWEVTELDSKDPNLKEIGKWQERVPGAEFGIGQSGHSQLVRFDGSNGEYRFAKLADRALLPFTIDSSGGTFWVFNKDLSKLYYLSMAPFGKAWGWDNLKASTLSCFDIASGRVLFQKVLDETATALGQDRHKECSLFLSPDESKLFFATDPPRADRNPRPTLHTVVQVHSATTGERLETIGSSIMNVSWAKGAFMNAEGKIFIPTFRGVYCYQSLTSEKRITAKSWQWYVPEDKDMIIHAPSALAFVDTKTGERYSSGKQVKSVAASSDGREIVTLHDNGTLELWKLMGGAPDSWDWD
ncbi:MAG: hypothetical protein WD342_12880 [Verrucomicrobiales bacterium]